MDFSKIVQEARSCRRFQQDKPLKMDQLLSLVDLARNVPSAANKQPLRYGLVTSPTINDQVFPMVKWAAMLKDWGGPKPGERPTGYIIIGVNDKKKTYEIDLGIAAQTIQLAARSKGIGCCMLGNIKNDQIHNIIDFPEEIKVVLILALGYPSEKCVLDNVETGESTVYWRDDNNIHHVPKYSLDAVILKQLS